MLHGMQWFGSEEENNESGAFFYPLYNIDLSQKEDESGIMKLQSFKDYWKIQELVHIAYELGRKDGVSAVKNSVNQAMNKFRLES